MDGKLRNMTSLYLVCDTSVLCLYRIGSKVANHRYIGSAGGHFEQVELNDARACVLREANEELGVVEKDLDGLELRYITHRLKDGEIRQNYYFFARWNRQKELVSSEGQLKWVLFEDIPSLNMPISAKHMIMHYLNKGRYDHTLYGGITTECGTEFYPMFEFEG